jgi:hypothetical protein
MAKTRRRLPAVAARSPAARRRHGAEPNAALKADLKEKLNPTAGAQELAAKPQAGKEPPAQEESVAPREAVEAPAQAGPEAATAAELRRGRADPLSG